MHDRALIGKSSAFTQNMRNVTIDKRRESVDKSVIDGGSQRLIMTLNTKLEKHYMQIIINLNYFQYNNIDEKITQF